MTTPVSVLEATVADLEANGWITDVVASLLIGAGAKDRAAFAELAEACRARDKAARAFAESGCESRQLSDDLADARRYYLAALARVEGAA